MRRFAFVFDAPEPENRDARPAARPAGAPDPDPDAVLAATRELVAAAATLGADPMRSGEALRAFRDVVWRRYDLEVAGGLPADVVRHVMACAIRLAAADALAAAPAVAGGHLIAEIGALTLRQAARGGCGDGIP